MSLVQLFALEGDTPRPLPVPAQLTQFDPLYEGLPLGVYSAFRTFEHNKFLYLDDHIARAQRSMALLGWEYRLDDGRLRRALHQLCTAYPAAEARVRFDILAAPAEQLGSPSRELIALMPFAPIPADWYKNGIQVGVASDLHRPRPLAKTADFVQARRPYQADGRYYEYLLLDEAGHILEGLSSNFYAVQDGVLYTAGDQVLEGITRKIILEQAAQLGIPVNFSPIPLPQLPNLQEAAISGSSRGLLPVVQVEDQPIGNGRPGPICHRLLSAYNSFIAQAVQTAVTIE